MKFFDLFIAVLLLSLSVFAQDEDQTCNATIDTEYYCALSSKIGNYCDNYVVVMETRADAKILVKAKVVDSCSSCSTYRVNLSKQAYTTLTEESEGKSDIIWAIYSKEGDLVRGPFYNAVDEVAQSYNLSNNSFIAAFKVLAGRIAANDISYGTFNITRGKNTVIRKTEEEATQAPEQGDDESKEVPIEDLKTEVDADVPADDIEIVDFDGENQDTITYDVNTGSDINTPKNKIVNAEDAVIVDSSSGAPVASEIAGSQGNSGATLGVVTALSCLGAGGFGLLFLKKKNPSKYDELKKKFPEAFSSLKRSTSKKSKGGVTLPTTNDYMPNDTIEEEEIPRITVYDNEDPYHRN